MIFQCLADQLLFALALTNHDILLGEKTQYGTLHRAYITGALVTLFGMHYMLAHHIVVQHKLIEHCAQRFVSNTHFSKLLLFCTY